MFLDLVTERLLLISALSWVLVLLVSSLSLLVVGHAGAGYKILLPLLAIWIVILAFFLRLLPASEARIPPL